MKTKSLIALFAIIFIGAGVLLFLRAPTKASSDWIARDYVENSLLQYRWAVKFFFDRYEFKGDEKVLDIGCGDGRLTKLISTYVPQGGVIGMDKSFSMISHARSAYPNFTFPNLDFLLSDATDSGFYQQFPQQFDLVVAFLSLHWIKDQKPILVGIKRVLKPGGKAYIRLTSKGWDPIQEIADELAASAKWEHHFRGFVDPVQRFSVAEYAQLVKEAGFLPIRIEDVRDNDTLQNAQLLSKQVKSWLPHAKHLASHLQNAFLADVTGAYLKKVPPEKEGTIHLYDCYLEIEIQKP